MSLMNAEATESAEATEAEATEATESTEAVPQEQTQEAGAVERPEWLPEKYKTPEDLAKAYKELESKMGKGEEELRKSIMAELEEAAMSDRPETKGDYQLPEDIDDSAVDSELLSWWADHAFENGYSQEEFQQGVGKYMEALGANLPDLEAEAAKLGDTAKDRIEAATLFARKEFPQDVMPAIERMCETAEGIMALEIIMDKMRDPEVSTEANSAGRLTEDSLRQMADDPRYWHVTQRDPAYVKQVDEAFRKFYGS